ncbi:MAG: M73 family metallopeptidase [Actinobacteria bacterium]|nr:M73 family metallopeptidase [Actinomycetota bacterium]
MNKLPKLAGKKAGGNVGRSMLAASMSVAAIAASVTGAYFTDSDAVGSNTIATGNVSLSTNPATNVVSMSNMAPGDVQYGSVTVTNDGSLQLRYALKSVTTEDLLAAQLDLTVWDEVAEGADADSTCSTTVPGTVLYAAAALGATTTGVQIFGNPATGGQSGDRVLAANTSEVLCLKVALPTDTGNTFESKTTTATFTFDSEQTVNNA